MKVERHKQPKEYSLGDFFYNVGQGLGSLAQGVTQLPSAIMSVGSDVAGEAKDLFTAGNTYTSSTDDILKSMGSDYQERYTEGNILKKFYEDPVSYMADLADVVGVGLGAKAVRSARRASQLGDLLGPESLPHDIGLSQKLFDDDMEEVLNFADDMDPIGDTVDFTPETTVRGYDAGEVISRWRGNQIEQQIDARGPIDRGITDEEIAAQEELYQQDLASRPPQLEGPDGQQFELYDPAEGFGDISPFAPPEELLQRAEQVFGPDPNQWPGWVHEDLAEAGVPPMVNPMDFDGMEDLPPPGMDPQEWERIQNYDPRNDPESSNYMPWDAPDPDDPGFSPLAGMSTEDLAAEAGRLLEDVRGRYGPETSRWPPEVRDQFQRDIAAIKEELLRRLQDTVDQGGGMDYDGAVEIPPGRQWSPQGEPMELPIRDARELDEDIGVYEHPDMDQFPDDVIEQMRQAAIDEARAAYGPNPNEWPLETRRLIMDFDDELINRGTSPMEAASPPGGYGGFADDQEWYDYAGTVEDQVLDLVEQGQIEQALRLLWPHRDIMPEEVRMVEEGMQRLRDEFAPFPADHEAEAFWAVHDRVFRPDTVPSITPEDLATRPSPYDELEAASPRDEYLQSEFDVEEGLSGMLAQDDLQTFQHAYDFYLRQGFSPEEAQRLAMSTFGPPRELPDGDIMNMQGPDPEIVRQAQQLAESYIEGGMDPDEAWNQALGELGVGDEGGEGPPPLDDTDFMEPEEPEEPQWSVFLSQRSDDELLVEWQQRMLKHPFRQEGWPVDDISAMSEDRWPTGTFESGDSERGWLIEEHLRRGEGAGWDREQLKQYLAYMNQLDMELKRRRIGPYQTIEGAVMDLETQPRPFEDPNSMLVEYEPGQGLDEFAVSPKQMFEQGFGTPDDMGWTVDRKQVDKLIDMLRDLGWDMNSIMALLASGGLVGAGIGMADQRQPTA